MRPPRLALLLAASAAAAAPATGQTTLRISAGMTAGTALVQDRIFSRDVEVGQTPAPTVALRITRGGVAGVRVGAEVRVAASKLEITDRFGTRDDGSFRTAAITATADGPLFGGIRWEAAGGIIKYLPAEEQGIFGRGGPGPWTIGAGASWGRPLGGRTGLVISLRYDLHPFNSEAMQGHGFSGDQRVHRAGLAVGIERIL